MGDRERSAGPGHRVRGRRPPPRVATGDAVSADDAVDQARIRRRVSALLDGPSRRLLARLKVGSNGVALNRVVAMPPRPRDTPAVIDRLLQLLAVRRSGRVRRARDLMAAEARADDERIPALVAALICLAVLVSSSAPRSARYAEQPFPDARIRRLRRSLRAATLRHTRAPGQTPAAALPPGYPLALTPFAVPAPPARRPVRRDAYAMFYVLVALGPRGRSAARWPRSSQRCWSLSRRSRATRPASSCPTPSSRRSPCCRWRCCPPRTLAARVAGADDRAGASRG